MKSRTELLKLLWKARTKHKPADIAREIGMPQSTLYRIMTEERRGSIVTWELIDKWSEDNE